MADASPELVTAVNEAFHAMDRTEFMDMIAKLRAKERRALEPSLAADLDFLDEIEPIVDEIIACEALMRHPLVARLKAVVEAPV